MSPSNDPATHRMRGARELGELGALATRSARRSGTRSPGAREHRDRLDIRHERDQDGYPPRGRALHDLAQRLARELQLGREAPLPELADQAGQRAADVVALGLGEGLG